MATNLCARAFRPSPTSFDRIASHTLSRRTAACAFSTTSSQWYPRQKNTKRGDRNKMRGVSAIRGTGLRPRQTLSVKLEDLAQPAKNTERTPVEVDPDHGLWAFFNKDRTGLTTPDDMNAHGRAWTLPELNRKSWEDLHALWWVCVRERNRIATDSWERERITKDKRFLFGEYEANERDKTIKETMKNIKRVLTERWYAREDAWKIVLNNEDPEVTWNREEEKLEYTPQVIDTESYMDDDIEGIEVDASEAEKSDAGKAEPPRLEGESKEKLSASEEEDVKRLSPFLEQADAKGASKEAKKTQQPAMEPEAVPVRSEKRI